MSEIKTSVLTIKILLCFMENFKSTRLDENDKHLRAVFSYINIVKVLKNVLEKQKERGICYWLILVVIAQYLF